MKNPIVMVYVGRGERGEELISVDEQTRWLIYLPESRNEALGMIATYHPDLVVLDAATDAELAGAVYPHVDEIHMPLLVVYDDEVQMAQWDHPKETPFRILPPGNDPIERIRGVNDLIDAMVTYGASRESCPCEN